MRRVFLQFWPHRGGQDRVFSAPIRDPDIMPFGVVAERFQHSHNLLSEGSQCGDSVWPVEIEVFKVTDSCCRPDVGQVRALALQQVFQTGPRLVLHPIDIFDLFGRIHFVALVVVSAT